MYLAARICAHTIYANVRAADCLCKIMTVSAMRVTYSRLEEYLLFSHGIFKKVFGFLLGASDGDGRDFGYPGATSARADLDSRALQHSGTLSY